MQLFYAIGGALWLSNLMLDLYMSPHGDRGPHKLLIEGLGVALAAGFHDEEFEMQRQLVRVDVAPRRYSGFG